MNILKYKRGQLVFFVNKPMHLHDKPDIEATVHHSFHGQNGDEYVIVESCSNGCEKYRMLHSNSLWDLMNGKSNHELLMEDPKYTMTIAVKAGIFNTDGTLTLPYRSDSNAYNLVNGIKIYDEQ